jgi:hypothetical protein
MAGARVMTVTMRHRHRRYGDRAEPIAHLQHGPPVDGADHEARRHEQPHRKRQRGKPQGKRTMIQQQAAERRHPDVLGDARATVIDLIPVG